MIVLEKSTESFTTFDLSTDQSNFLARFDQLVAQSLMVSFSMEMVQVAGDGSSQRPLAEEDYSLEAFGLQTQVKPFEMGVQIGVSHR